MKNLSYQEYLSAVETLLTECACVPFGRESEAGLDPELFVDPDYAGALQELDGPVCVVTDAVVAYDGFGNVLCWTWYDDPSSNDAADAADADYDDASYLSRWLDADDDEDDEVAWLDADGYPVTDLDLEWMIEEEEYQSSLRAAKMGLEAVA